MRTLLLSLLWCGTALADTWVQTHGVVHFVVEGPIDDVVGETRKTTGTLTFDPDNWSRGTGAIGVDLNSIRTGIDQRDKDMQVEFLETGRFPRAVLFIEKVERPSETALTPGGTVKGDAVGSFELHGIRRQVRVPVTLVMDAEQRVRVSGQFDVPFADYGVQRPQRLFLKLGDTAIVSFGLTLSRRPEPTAGVVAPGPESIVPTVTKVQPPAAKAKPRPRRKPKPVLAVTYLFKGDEPAAKGERLFHAATIGGEGNKLTCFHCHAKTDERDGLTLKDGHARPATTLYNAGQRPQFWGGFAKTIGQAADICQKQYMVGDGLTEQQRTQLTAFIDAISPDPAPALDYGITYQSMDSSLREPTGGDAKRGKQLAERFCMTCHLDGRVGPVWAPGLYEPDWVVRRVRRLDGHHNRQMPNWTITRLPDSDLRDIVTYLASPASAPPIFDRGAKGSVVGLRDAAP